MLGASSLLAWALRERRWAAVDEALASAQVECAVSAVNLLEAVSKLVGRGLPDAAVDPVVAALPAKTVPFDRTLALAAARQVPALTADRVGVEVRLVRPA